MLTDWDAAREQPLLLLCVKFLICASHHKEYIGLALCQPPRGHGTSLTEHQLWEGRPRAPEPKSPS